MFRRTTMLVCIMVTVRITARMSGMVIGYTVLTGLGHILTAGAVGVMACGDMAGIEAGQRVSVIW